MPATETELYVSFGGVVGSVPEMSGRAHGEGHTFHYETIRLNIVFNFPIAW